MQPLSSNPIHVPTRTLLVLIFLIPHHRCRPAEPRHRRDRARPRRRLAPLPKRNPIQQTVRGRQPHGGHQPLRLRNPTSCQQNIRPMLPAALPGQLLGRRLRRTTPWCQVRVPWAIQAGGARGDAAGALEQGFRCTPLTHVAHAPHRPRHLTGGS